MMLNDKKIALLNILQQQKNAISLPELITLSPTPQPERTIRNWLNEWVKKGIIEKSGHKRSTRYYCRGMVTTEKLSAFSQLSLPAIQYVRAPIYERKPVTYHPEWLDEYEPNVTHYLLPEIIQQLQTAGQRSNNKEPAGTYAHKIYNKLLIDLSYNSSRLEGNTYSLADTQRLVLEGSNAEGKLDEEKIMILNHKEAIRYLTDNINKIQIEPTQVFTLHYLLSDGLVTSKYAGNVRDSGVRIALSTYIPFENPEQLTNQLKNICKKAAAIYNPYEQSFFLLVHLAYLQAFIDVNKRTSRLSANIPLLKNNLVPLSFNDIEKNDYSSAMIAIYELNDIKPLADLYVFSYLRTCQQYDATVESIGFDAVRVRYRQQRRDMIRHIIIEQLTGEAMQHYIQNEMAKLIKLEDQSYFTEDLSEDLQEININRINGLGISLQQLQAWLLKSK